MYWKPFYVVIDAGIQLNIAVHLAWTWHFHMGVDVGIWTPPFGGFAKVDLWIVSFKIPFGADERTEEFLNWEQFKVDYLPKHTAKTDDDKDVTQYTITNAKVTGGLRKQIKDGETPVWIINPQQFKLQTQTAVPTTVELAQIDDQGNITASEQGLDTAVSQAHSAWQQHIGIPPMSNTTNITSKHALQFLRKDESGDYADYNATAYERFDFQGVWGDSPAALWKNAPPDRNKDTVIPDTLLGLNITPKDLKPDQTQTLSLKTLLVEASDILTYTPYVQAPSETLSHAPIDTVADTIQTDADERTPILQSLQDLHLITSTTVEVSQLAKANSGALLQAPVVTGA